MCTRVDIAIFGPKIDVKDVEVPPYTVLHIIAMFSVVVVVEIFS